MSMLVPETREKQEAVLEWEKSIWQAKELLENPYDRKLSHQGNKLANYTAYLAVTEQDGEYQIEDQIVENSEKPAKIRGIAERLVENKIDGKERLKEMIEKAEYARACVIGGESLVQEPGEQEGVELTYTGPIQNTNKDEDPLDRLIKTTDKLSPEGEQNMTDDEIEPYEGEGIKQNIESIEESIQGAYNFLESVEELEDEIENVDEYKNSLSTAVDNFEQAANAVECLESTVEDIKEDNENYEEAILAVDNYLDVKRDELGAIHERLDDTSELFSDYVQDVEELGELASVVKDRTGSLLEQIDGIDTSYDPNEEALAIADEINETL